MPPTPAMALIEDSIWQDLLGPNGGKKSQLRRGAMVVTRKKEGFAWLASDSTPFRIWAEYSNCGLFSTIRMDGCRGQLQTWVAL